MNILISLKNNDQILLRADNLNYELCKARTRTDEVSGSVTQEWTPFKFFASLPQALNCVLDLKIRASEASTLKELAVDLESARQEINAVWSTEVGNGGCSCRQ